MRGIDAAGWPRTPPRAWERPVGQTPFDFGELLTLSSRPVIAAAVRRGLGFYFDYPSGPTRVFGDGGALQRSLFRHLMAISELLQDGNLIVSGEADPGSEPGTVVLRIDAAASGKRLPDVDVAAVLAGLGLVQDPVDPELPHVVSAAGSCPIVGGDVRYRCVPSAGALLSLTVRFPGQVMADLTPPNAHGCPASILYDGHESVHGLAHRLRRLGWDVSLFRDTDTFARAILESDGNHRLAIAVGSAVVRPADLLKVNAALGDVAPERLERIHAVRAGSSALEAPPTPGWQVNVIPFLPSELWDFTRRAEPDDASFHHESRPTPLPAPDRPRVLVVDDDEVNRIIASGLLQMIGYDAQSVASGHEAIALCQRGAPDLVLMDINMPGLDGYEATAALKRLQQSGGIPPFPILAATAAGNPERSLARGLDGHLDKPLLAEDLRVQLHRALKGLATRL